MTESAGSGLPTLVESIEVNRFEGDAVGSPLFGSKS